MLARPKSSRLLSDIRREIADVTDNSPNAAAVEDALNQCLATIREIRGRDKVFIRAEHLERFLSALETTRQPLMDDERRRIIALLKETLGK